MNNNTSADPGAGFIVELVDTADMPDGQPLPPYIDDDGAHDVAGQGGVRFAVERATTADLPDGQPLPPFIGMSSAPSANRRRVYHDRAAVVAVAIAQIYETAPTPERREVIEDYLRDELIDAQRQALADCHEFSSER